MRRSPRLASPSATEALGSCQRMVRPRVPFASARSRATLRASSAAVSMPNHWKGVWGFGTKPPTEATTVTDLL